MKLTRSTAVTLALALVPVLGFALVPVTKQYHARKNAQEYANHEWTVIGPQYDYDIEDRLTLYLCMKTPDGLERCMPLPKNHPQIGDFTALRQDNRVRFEYQSHNQRGWAGALDLRFIAWGADYLTVKEVR